MFAGGRLTLTRRLRRRLAGAEAPYVVAADSGAATALRLGLTPHVVVGDMDSIDGPTLQRLRARGVPLDQHPRDKDATDGELAIQRALQSNPDCLVLIGFLGGPRLDQELASILLLARVDVPATLLDGSNECRLLRPREVCRWSPEPGEIVSLIPLSHSVGGVRAHGLRWALQDDSLERGSTRGVSNEPSGSEASVSIQRGLLLVTRFFPDPE